MLLSYYCKQSIIRNYLGQVLAVSFGAHMFQALSDCIVIPLEGLR